MAAVTVPNPPAAGAPGSRGILPELCALERGFPRSLLQAAGQPHQLGTWQWAASTRRKKINPKPSSQNPQRSQRLRRSISRPAPGQVRQPPTRQRRLPGNHDSLRHPPRPAPRRPRPPRRISGCSARRLGCCRASGPTRVVAAQGEEGLVLGVSGNQPQRFSSSFKPAPGEEKSRAVNAKVSAALTARAVASIRVEILSGAIRKPKARSLCRPRRTPGRAANHRRTPCEDFPVRPGASDAGNGGVTMNLPLESMAAGLLVAGR